MMINYQTHSIHVWHIYLYIYHIFWIGLPCRQIKPWPGMVWENSVCNNMFTSQPLSIQAIPSKLISIFEEMGAVTMDALSSLQPFPGLFFLIMQQQKGMQALLVTLAKLRFFQLLRSWQFGGSRCFWWIVGPHSQMERQTSMLSTKQNMKTMKLSRL